MAEAHKNDVLWAGYSTVYRVNLPPPLVLPSLQHGEVGRKWICLSHFTDENTESQKGVLLAQIHSVNRGAKTPSPVLHLLQQQHILLLR